MECPLCGNHKNHKHGKTSKGSQRYYCPECLQIFTDTFDTLYYTIVEKLNLNRCARLLQAHVGSSLRGISRTVNWAYNTVISLVRAASQKGQAIQQEGTDNDATARL